MQEKLENATFCCSPTLGQGLVDRSDCKCANEGKSPLCKAYKEKETFNSRYRELEEKQFSRTDIITFLKKEFDWANSEWLQYNVKE